MNHPSCDHPVSNMSDDYLGIECCICSDRPCEAVSVEAMRVHRLFDIYLYSQEVAGACYPPF